MTGYGIFNNATGENALEVLEQAIKTTARLSFIMTYHGFQFHANEREASKKTSWFGKILANPGIRQILADVNRLQTNGKVERLHGEMQRKLPNLGNNDKVTRWIYSWTGIIIADCTSPLTLRVWRHYLGICKEDAFHGRNCHGMAGRRET